MERRGMALGYTRSQFKNRWPPPLLLW